MLNVPIALRTRNRAFYLDITLKSIIASNLPSGSSILVLDDCSDDELMLRYLFTDEEVPVEYDLPTNHPQWDNLVGDIPKTPVIGIRNKYEVVQPDTRKGVRGGIFWCVDFMMQRFPKAEAIIIVEADVVFNRDWYQRTTATYLECKDQEGPNGNQAGLVSCYDRRGKSMEEGWGWRSVRKNSRGGWSCGNGIGGVMYLVTRALYEAGCEAFRRKYNPKHRAGDTSFQALCGIHKFTIAATSPSYCQHIGVNSTAWPEKGWRRCMNFLKPMCYVPVI